MLRLGLYGRWRPERVKGLRPMETTGAIPNLAWPQHRAAVPLGLFLRVAQTGGLLDALTTK